MRKRNVLITKVLTINDEPPIFRHLKIVGALAMPRRLKPTMCANGNQSSP